MSHETGPSTEFLAVLEQDGSYACEPRSKREREQMRLAEGVLQMGLPERMAAQAAGVSPGTVARWLTEDDADSLRLRAARNSGKLGLASVIAGEALKGASYVRCASCKEDITECPHCNAALPEKGDPKWAAWMLEKHPEFRQRVEVGDLQKEFEQAAEMSESEIAAATQRSIAYPDALTERAIRGAFEKPGPVLLKYLRQWAMKNPVIEQETST